MALARPGYHFGLVVIPVPKMPFWKPRNFNVLQSTFETVQKVGDEGDRRGEQGMHAVPVWRIVSIEVKSICYCSGVSKNKGLRVAKQRNWDSAPPDIVGTMRDTPLSPSSTLTCVAPAQRGMR
jgi:hypothetical protein